MYIFPVVVTVLIGTHAEMLPQLIPAYLLFCDELKCGK